MPASFSFYPTWVSPKRWWKDNLNLNIFERGIMIKPYGIQIHEMLVRDVGVPGVPYLRYLETTWHERDSASFPFPAKCQVSTSGFTSLSRLLKALPRPKEEGCTLWSEGAGCQMNWLFFILRNEFIWCFRVTCQLQTPWGIFGGFAKMWKETARATKKRLLADIQRACHFEALKPSMSEES